jgi:glycosyltransferase involved in cell wall biosynthesis
MARLKKIAGDCDRIEFLGRVSDEDKAKLYSEAIAFINPQEEDFGITPLESMASGRPVIAFRKGGATETVIEGKTGVFFDQQTPEHIMSAVRELEELEFDSSVIRKWSEEFSVRRFKQEIGDFVSQIMSEK